MARANGAMARANGAMARANGAMARANGAMARANGAMARANGAMARANSERFIGAPRVRVRRRPPMNHDVEQARSGEPRGGLRAVQYGDFMPITGAQTAGGRSGERRMRGTPRQDGRSGQISASACASGTRAGRCRRAWGPPGQGQAARSCGYRWWVARACKGTR